MAVGQDLGDAHHGLVLPVPGGAPIALAPLLLEHDDLVGPALLDQLGGHAGALDQGRAERRLIAVANHQDLVENQATAGLAVEFLDREQLFLGDPILLAACPYDCDHLSNAPVM